MRQIIKIALRPPPQRQNSRLESQNFLAELALNVWRIDTKIKGTDNPQQRAISSAVSRIYDLLSQNHITIKDYTGIKYNDGLNIDIIECVQVVAKDSNDTSEMILETLQPSILINGELYKKAKVIKETKINPNQTKE